MTISGGRTEQFDIFCRVTGFTSDFLSSLSWTIFGSFTEAFSCVLDHAVLQSEVYFTRFLQVLESHGFSWFIFKAGKSLGP